MEIELLNNQIAHAIKSGDLERFELLLENFDDVNVNISPYANLGLFVCLQKHKNAHKMLDMLLKKNLNPHQKDPLGKTLIETILDKFLISSNLLDFIEVLYNHKISFLKKFEEKSPINILLDSTNLSYCSKDLVVQAFRLIASKEPGVLTELSIDKIYELLHFIIISNSPYSVETFKILLPTVLEDIQNNSLGRELMEHTVHYSNQYTSLFIQALTDINVSPNFVCGNGEWLITKSIKSGSEYSVDIVDTLLRNNARIIQSDGRSTLYDALEINEKPYFEAMYEVLFSRCQRSIIESFMFQAVTLNIENIDNVISKAIDHFEISPNLSNDNSNLLYTAVFNLHSNSLPILTALLDRGANPNIETNPFSLIFLVINKTYAYRTIGVQQGEEILDLLINRGTDLDKTTDVQIENQPIMNLTPLMYALYLNPNEEVRIPLHMCILKLVDSGANLAAKNNQNITCFHCLSIGSQFNPRLSKANADYILDNVKDINDLNIIDNFDLSPASCAISMRDYHTLDLLWRSGANINIAGNPSKTPLAIALANRDFYGVALLLSMGADPYAPIDNEGNNLFQSDYGDEMKNMYSRGSYSDSLINNYFRFFNLTNHKHERLTKSEIMSPIVLRSLILNSIVSTVRLLESKLHLLAPHEQVEFNGDLLIKIKQLISIVAIRVNNIVNSNILIPNDEIYSQPEFNEAKKAFSNLIEYFNKNFRIIENDENDQIEFPESVTINLIKSSQESSCEKKTKEISRIKSNAYISRMHTIAKFLESKLHILILAIDSNKICRDDFSEVGNTLLHVSNYLHILGESFDDTAFEIKRSAANLGDVQSTMILSSFKYNSKRMRGSVLHDDNESTSNTNTDKRRRV